MTSLGLQFVINACKIYSMVVTEEEAKIILTLARTTPISCYRLQTWCRDLTSLEICIGRSYRRQWNCGSVST